MKVPISTMIFILLVESILYVLESRLSLEKPIHSRVCLNIKISMVMELLIPATVRSLAVDFLSIQVVLPMISLIRALT